MLDYIEEKAIKFIEDNIDLIEANNFEEFYTKRLRSGLDGGYAGTQITEMLLESGINPLFHMSKVPYGFIYNSDIEELIIPNNIKIIAWSAIRDMNKLVDLYIPDSVIEIGQYAFDGCSFKDISLPKSLQHIDRYVFRDCYKLETVTFRGTVSEWKSLRKNPGWKKGSKIKKIKCTDGEI